LQFCSHFVVLQCKQQANYLASVAVWQCGSDEACTLAPCSGRTRSGHRRCRGARWSQHAAPASVRPCPPQTPAARVLPAGRLRVVRALQPPALGSCMPATPAARSSAAGLTQCRRPPPPKPSRRLASSREGNGQAVRGGVSGGGLGLGVLGGGPFLRGPPGPPSRI